MARLKDGRKWRGFILSRGSKHFLAIKLIILLNLYHKWLMLPEMKCPSISLSHLFRDKNICWQIALETEVLHLTLNLSEIWYWIYLKFDTEFIWNLIWNFSLLRSLNFLNVCLRGFLSPLFNQEKIWIIPHPHLNMNWDKRDRFTEKWEDIKYPPKPFGYLSRRVEYDSCNTIVWGP